ncbi:MAG: TldD/PmbA family protein [bacterium]
MSKLLTEYNSLIKDLLKKAEKLGIYAVIRIQSYSSFVESYKNGCIDDVSVSTDIGLGMYCFTDTGHVAFSSTNDLTDEKAIIDLLESTSKIAKKNKDLGFASSPQIFSLPFQENINVEKNYKRIDIKNIDSSHIEEKINNLEKYIKSVNQNVNCYFIFYAYDELWRIARSDGTDVDFSTPKYRLRIDLSLKSGDINSSTMIRKTFPDIDLLFGEEINKTIDWNIKYLEDQLKAQAVKPGHYALILDSDLAGVLTHEAFGHACESDAIAENNSILRGDDGKFISGQKVAADGVNIYDDEPEVSHGFYPYGSFGNVRKRAILVENGILKESLSDIFTSGIIGVENKNCERSQFYSSVAIPRMSTTTLELDDNKLKTVPENIDLTNLKDIQKLLDKDNVFDKFGTVLYFIKMTGGSVNMKTGDFMFGSGFSYELTKDSITPLKPCSFSGQVLEALKSINSGYGDINRNHLGMCGKSGQTALVGQGGHSLILFEPSEYINIA